MADRYFFDKRDMKYFFKKYGIMLLIAVPILIAINVLFNMWFGAKDMMWLDIVFLCVILVIYEAIWNGLKRREESKQGEKNREGK